MDTGRKFTYCASLSKFIANELIFSNNLEGFILLLKDRIQVIH
jgi:hypothetical protein